MHLCAPFRPWPAALLATAALSGPAAAAGDPPYWTQSGAGGFMTNGPAFMMQAGLDGSGSQDVVVGAQGVAFHVVVVTAPVSTLPEPDRWALALAGLAVLGWRLRRDTAARSRASGEPSGQTRRAGRDGTR